MHKFFVLPTEHEYLKRKCVSPVTVLNCEQKFYVRGQRIHRSTRHIVILTGKEQCGDYLKVLILSDQLLPGKNLISLDAFKAVLSLFILRNKVLQLTSALPLAAAFTT